MPEETEEVFPVDWATKVDTEVRRCRDIAEAMREKAKEYDDWADKVDAERSHIIESCTPSGCQCMCHTPMGMGMSHAVACCSGAT